MPRSSTYSSPKGRTRWREAPAANIQDVTTARGGTGRIRLSEGRLGVVFVEGDGVLARRPVDIDPAGGAGSGEQAVAQLFDMPGAVIFEDVVSSAEVAVILGRRLAAERCVAGVIEVAVPGGLPARREAAALVAGLQMSFQVGAGPVPVAGEDSAPEGAVRIRSHPDAAPASRFAVAVSIGQRPFSSADVVS